MLTNSNCHVILNLTKPREPLNNANTPWSFFFIKNRMDTINEKKK